MKPYVIGLGEVLWDVLPEGKKLGGAPANFAYHVSQFGYDTMPSALSAMMRLVKKRSKRSTRSS